MDSPVRLGVSPATATPTVFIARGFEALVSLSWNPGLYCLSHSSVVPPGLSACKCGITCSASHRLPWSTSHHLTESCLHPGQYHYYLTVAPRQRYMSQMKEQIKAPEKIKLSDQEIANLSDAQFKTCNQDDHRSG